MVVMSEAALENLPSLEDGLAEVNGCHAGKLGIVKWEMSSDWE